MTGDLPTRVGVYGGGRMGAGIAHAFLTGGSEVVVVEASRDAAQAASERVLNLLERDASWVGDGTVRDRLHFTVDPDDLSGANLVVEAVPEDLAAKQAVLARVRATCPAAVLATNTSSLAIEAVAEGLARPDLFLGMHFFNPVPASALVELIVGRETDPAVVATARKWTEALRKTPITVQSTPGFATSRLGVALALEAMRMLEEGVASAEDIDAAMTLGYRHQMGPLRTTDLVGLDVRLAIAENLARHLGSRFEPPQILRDHVEVGRLGRKSGQGFFPW